MKRILLAIFALTLCACGRRLEEDSTRNLDAIEFSPVTRAELTEYDAVKFAEKKAALDEFACNLVDGVKFEGNYVISPYSLSTALAILSTGASSTTRDQIVSALGFGADSETSMESFFYLTKNLVQGLSICNSIWIQDGFPLKEEFRSNSMKWFDAYSANVNFSNEKTADILNYWCSESTDGRIKNFYNPGDISAETALLLMNTLVFSSRWLVPSYDKQAEFIFTDKSGNSYPVTAFSAKDQLLDYYEDERFKGLRLYFDNGNYALFFIPKAGDISFAEAYGEYMLKSELCEVNFTIPIVDISIEKYDFSAVLKSLSLTDIYNASRSNFERMIDVSGLVVGKVMQTVHITIDEQGCEAAAATSIDLGATDVGPGLEDPQYKKVEFIANRPFYFAIGGKTPLLFVGEYKF